MPDQGLSTGEEGKSESRRRLGSWIRGVGHEQYPSLYPGFDVSRETILNHGTLGLEHPDLKYLRDTSHYLDLPGTVLDPYQFSALKYEDQPAWMQHDNDLLAKKIERYAGQPNYAGAVENMKQVHAERQGMIGQADWLAFRDAQIRKLRGFTGDEEVLGTTTSNPLFQENADTLINTANKIYRLDAERRNLENSPNYWEPRMVEDPLNDWARQQGLPINPNKVLRHFETSRLENMRARIGAEQSNILRNTGPRGFESMHSNLQEYLAKIGLNKQGANLSGRLLSGVPLDFLDEASDKAVFNMKRQAQLQSEKVKMFQSRYANDAPFRTSVNQGLKAKLPGVLAAGLGAYIVKNKMDEGETLPAAVGQTVGEGILGAAKFKIWDQFVGPTLDLNANEDQMLAEANARNAREYERRQKLPKISPEEAIWRQDQQLINDIGGIPKSTKQVGNELRDRIASGNLSKKESVQMSAINSQMAKVEKEKKTLEQLRVEQSQKVSDHIIKNMSMSPIWNEVNGQNITSTTK